jgi:hypothetical protein
MMENTPSKAVEERHPAIATMAAPAHLASGSKLLLLIGAWSGVVGALLAFVANGLHPHPTDFRLEALLQQIADSPTWATLHLTLICALFLILGALVAITFTVDGEPGATVVRFACVAALLGGALILVSTAMDGFAMNQLAHSWLDAPLAEKATALRVADALENAQYAVFSLSIVLFLGLGIFLYGLAIALGSVYPKVLGWLAMVSGAGAFVVGVVQALSGPSFRSTEIFFVLFSMLSTIWVLSMGVVMWRKAHLRHAPIHGNPLRR